MKSLANPCERWQKNLCLLASGALTGQDKAEVEGHLATCPNCRQRFAELTKVSAPLADWERNVAHIEPSQAAQLRWAKAIHQAAGTAASRVKTPNFSFNLFWRELIWPCRRIWAGLAAVWLGILVFNHSQTEPRQTFMAKSTAPSGEMRVALREQRRVLDELIGVAPSRPAAAVPSRRPNNQPRSERRSVAMA